MPEVHLVDMRREVKRGNPSPFSAALRERLETCLEKGDQAILFLNRRGYSQTVICRDCGYVTSRSPITARRTASNATTAAPSTICSPPALSAGACTSTMWARAPSAWSASSESCILRRAFCAWTTIRRAARRGISKFCSALPPKRRISSSARRWSPRGMISPT